MELVLFRQMEVKRLLLRRVFGIKALNGVQPPALEPLHQRLQLSVPQLHLIGVRQGDLSPRGLDGLHAGAGVRLEPLHLLPELLRVQIAVKGLPVGAHVPVLHHHLGEVRPGDHLAPCQLLHLGKLHIYALSP